MSSAKIAEDKKFSWYHLSLPLSKGPYGILTDPQAISGLPVFAYRIVSAKPLRKEFYIPVLTVLHHPTAL